MDSANLTSPQIQDLLEAQAHIWHHNYSFQNSLALRNCVQLGIADAIEKHGKPITLSELANALSIHPTKVNSLSHLMRLLVNSNFFSEKKLPESEESVFGLTTNSQLLLTDHALSMAPLVLNTSIDQSLSLSNWLKSDTELTPFEMSHGKSMWEQVSDSKQEVFNRAMASDARIVATALLNSEEGKENFFKGVESIVDVGGGDGTMAKAIAQAYPGIKCTVLDLPHVVEGKKSTSHNVEHVGGDMFKAIPPAQVVMLKMVLHDWNDEDCIKILRKCKEAIPRKDEGGKVIIIDMVMENHKEDPKYVNTQGLMDLEMICVVGGKERTEEEWKILFNGAGFSSIYKILPILGLKSVIEIYPS